MTAAVKHYDVVVIGSGHAGVEAADELVDVAPVLHEPEFHVDPDGLGPDQIDDRRPAVFELRVAQAFLRPRTNGRTGKEDEDEK